VAKADACIKDSCAAGFKTWTVSAEGSNVGTCAAAAGTAEAKKLAAIGSECDIDVADKGCVEGAQCMYASLKTDEKRSVADLKKLGMECIAVADCGKDKTFDAKVYV